MGPGLIVRAVVAAIAVVAVAAIAAAVKAISSAGRFRRCCMQLFPFACGALPGHLAGPGRTFAARRAFVGAAAMTVRCGYPHPAIKRCPTNRIEHERRAWRGEAAAASDEIECTASRTIRCRTGRVYTSKRCPLEFRGGSPRW